MMVLAGEAFAVFLVIFLGGYLISYLLSRPGTRDVPTRTAGDKHEQLRYATELIADGFDHEPDWRALMVAAFDETIEPRLDQYHAAAKRLAEQPRKQWPDLIEKQIDAWSQADRVSKPRGNVTRLSR